MEVTEGSAELHAPETSTSVVSTTTPVATTVAPATAAVAAPNADAAKEKRLANGTKFLSDPRVKSTALNRRVNFLKSKGLSAEEIVDCFQRAGQPQTLETVTNLINSGGVPSAAVAPPPAAAPPLATATTTVTGVYAPPLGGQQQQQVYATPHQQLPPHHLQPMLQPAGYAHLSGGAPPPPLPPLPPPRTDRWKDVVLAGGAAAMVSWGLWKAFEAFSPFEFRWKEENVGSASSSRRGGSNTVNNSNRSTTSRRSTSVVAPPSSESEIDGRLQRTAPPLPPPATPTSQSTTTTTATTIAAANAQQLTELQDRVKVLEQELADAKTALEKEKRDRAEQAVSSGKMKGQLTTLGRQNDKNAAEVLRLTKELDIAKLELERRPPLPTTAPTTAVPNVSVGSSGNEQVELSTASSLPTVVPAADESSLAAAEVATAPPPAPVPDVTAANDAQGPPPPAI